MVYYDDYFKKVKDGDKILTSVNFDTVERIVEYKNEKVFCEKYWFYWDFFFEVNKLIKII